MLRRTRIFTIPLHDIQRHGVNWYYSIVQIYAVHILQFAYFKTLYLLFMLFTWCRASSSIVIVNYEQNVIWRVPFSSIFCRLVYSKLTENVLPLFSWSNSKSSKQAATELLLLFAVNIYRNIWHYIPAKSTFHNHRCGNLRSRIAWSIYFSRLFTDSSHQKSILSRVYVWYRLLTADSFKGGAYFSIKFKFWLYKQYSYSKKKPVCGNDYLNLGS
jgi:hypothetical protein